MRSHIAVEELQIQKREDQNAHYTARLQLKAPLGSRSF